MRQRRKAVVGQVARDLVLRVDQVPEQGGSAPVTRRIERLGGKSANHALGLHQLGVTTAVVGVVGTDHTGTEVLDEAARDGLDMSGVTRRGKTALLVDVVDDAGRRLLEDVPASALLGADDIVQAAPLFHDADVVSLQLQQPSDALLTAAHLGKSNGARVVLDGATTTDRDALLALADLVRADATETGILTGTEVTSRADAAHATDWILAQGPELAAVTVPGEGDYVAWQTGTIFLPYSDVHVVDPTGAGDAFLAGLVAALIHGATPSEAAHAAARSAAATVTRLGGHPDLTQ